MTDWWTDESLTTKETIERFEALGPERTRGPGRRKPTKRWCKGKVGREHQPELLVSPTPWHTKCHESEWGLRDEKSFWWCIHRVRCSVCQKMLVRHPPCPDAPAGMKVAWSRW